MPVFNMREPYFPFYFLIVIVDGSWGEWGEFGECSMDCGPGVKTRKRSCSSPESQHGGRNCKGDAVEDAECKLKECGKNDSSVLQLIFNMLMIRVGK